MKLRRRASLKKTNLSFLLFWNADINFSAVINSTFIFIWAWLISFYIFDIFTIIPAFTLGARMIIYSCDLDFNSVNTAAEDVQLWTDADNIIHIFATPAITLTLCILLAVIVLIKWKPRGKSNRRFLFWFILCGVVRLFGNYLSGSFFSGLFNVWNWNLVTDFMLITTNIWAEMLFDVGVAVAMYVAFHLMANQVHLLFNPYSRRRLDRVVSELFLPVIIGLQLLLVCYIGSWTITEIFCGAILEILVVFVLCRRFVSLYRSVPGEHERKRIEKIKVFPIGMFVLFLIGKIFLDSRGGILLEYSQYKRYFLENFFIVVAIIIALVVALITFRLVRRKRRKDVFSYYKEEIETKWRLEGSSTDELLKAYGVQRHSDLDKYRKMWNDSDQSLSTLSKKKR